MSGPGKQARKWLASDRLLRIAAVLALVALGLMVWGIFVPTAIPIVLSMTVGQALGTASFATYLIVLVRDFRRSRVLAASDEEDPS